MFVITISSFKCSQEILLCFVWPIVICGAEVCECVLLRIFYFEGLLEGSPRLMSGHWSNGTHGVKVLKHILCLEAEAELSSSDRLTSLLYCQHMLR